MLLGFGLLSLAYVEQSIIGGSSGSPPRRSDDDPETYRRSETSIGLDEAFADLVSTAARHHHRAAFAVAASMGRRHLGVTSLGHELWPSLGDIVWNTTTNFKLVAIPLFVLMGEIILQSGLPALLFRHRRLSAERVPGGLAQIQHRGVRAVLGDRGSSVATTLTSARSRSRNAQARL